MPDPRRTTSGGNGVLEMTKAGREIAQIIKAEYERHGIRLHAGALATLRARMSFIGNHGTAEAFAIEWSVFRENVPEMGAELRRLIHLAAMESRGPSHRPRSRQRKPQRTDRGVRAKAPR
jgi:hypothetical protein